MTKLQKLQQAYQATQARSTEARARFVAEIRRQRDAGRTLADIGNELQLTRQRVERLAADTQLAKGNSDG